MKAPLSLAIALLLQLASVSSSDPIADPHYLRYQRSLTPTSTTGQACAILDGAVFAHATSESLNDLRIFAQQAGKTPVETPFNFSVSGTQTADDDPASIRNLHPEHDDIAFDLEMPHRAYSAIALDLAARNFLAVAKVSTTPASSSTPKELGTFTLFDLTAHHLSRLTTLALAESSYPELHISLHITPAPNTPHQDFDASTVRGAIVPPSRDAQTLYTAIASTSSIAQRDSSSIATIRIPAHVPVERLSFQFDPEFAANFSRTVHIAAFPQSHADNNAIETLSSGISRVRIPADATTGAPAADSEQTSIEAVLGANLRSDGEVQVLVDNANGQALPIASVQLEMRQRKVCFDATPDMAYTLMYGDPSLHTPSYDNARNFVPSPVPAILTLQPEQHNPTFTARGDTMPYALQHPEIFWVIALAILAAFGSIVLRRSRSRYEKIHPHR